MIQIRQVINSLRYPSEHYWTQISSILNSVPENVTFCADINDTVLHCFPPEITFWGPVTTMPLNGFFQYIFLCKVQSVLIMYRFCICEFAYLLKRICNFICRISICSTFIAINGHMQSSEKSESLNIPEHPSCGWTRCSCVSSHNVNKCLFWGLLTTVFLHFWASSCDFTV